MTVGFPLTPSPLDTLIPVPPAIDRKLHVSVPVLAGMPVLPNPSSAARSLARVKTNVPAVVIGLPEMENPAAGAVAATEVTVPDPPPPPPSPVVSTFI